MPFTTVPDKASLAVFTEANWDTDIAANLNTGLWVPLGRSLPVGLSVVDFVGIPSGYSALLLSWFGRSTLAGTVASLTMTLNSDVGATYDGVRVNADGTVLADSEVFAGTSASLGAVPGATAVADTYGGGFLLLPAYDQTDRHKSFPTVTFWKRTNAAAGLSVRYAANFWRSTAAITQMTVTCASGVFTGESAVNLYGLGTV